MSDIPKSKNEAPPSLAGGTFCGPEPQALQPQALVPPCRAQPKRLRSQPPPEILPICRPMSLSSPKFSAKAWRHDPTAVPRNSRPTSSVVMSSGSPHRAKARSILRRCTNSTASSPRMASALSAITGAPVDQSARPSPDDPRPCRQAADLHDAGFAADARASTASTSWNAPPIQGWNGAAPSSTAASSRTAWCTT